MIRTIEEYKKLPANVDKSWATKQLKEFIEYIEKIEVTDEGMFSRSYENLHGKWFGYIYERLNESGFVNGEPEENTWEKRPKAAFWWCLNCTFIQGHHLTSRELREVLYKILYTAIKNINQSIA